MRRPSTLVPGHVEPPVHVELLETDGWTLRTEPAVVVRLSELVAVQLGPHATITGHRWSAQTDRIRRSVRTTSS